MTDIKNDSKNTSRSLVIILAVCLVVLAILAVLLAIKFAPAPATPSDLPKTEYIELPALKDIALRDAKDALDALNISYEIVPTKSKTPNKVEKIEYFGKEDGGKHFAEIGTQIKLYSNEVAADRIVYLTFDDGPIVNYNADMEVTYTTAELLDVLDAYGVKASFFLCGYQMVKSDRSRFVNDIFDRGHLVSCHTYSHDFGEIYGSADNFISDVKRFENELKDILGEEKYSSCGKYIRFPGGTTSNGLLTRSEAAEYIKAVRGEGYKVYDWTVLTNDADNSYRLDGESDRDYFLRSMTKGLESSKGKGHPLIILMHDKKTTAGCLGDILDYLVSEGYYFDTLDNCPEYTFAEN